MASYEDMVVPRGRLKAAITRCIQKLKVLFNKDDVEKVKEGDEKLQAAYVKLEEYIMEMSEAAKTEDEIRECETYLTDVQTKCSEALQSCSDYYEEKLGKKLMKTELVTDSKKDEVAVTPGETVQALKEIAALVSLPSLEIQSFEGDPLQYHRFISVFENSVDNVIANDSAKLNRLLRYTAGSAYATISGCAIMGGTTGYQKARQLLKEEFGNPLVIAERMTAVLRDGKPIRNVNELMSLSHDLINCDVALTKIGDMPELNSQHFLASVVNRLQPYLKNKWKRYATDTRERHGRYPHFGELCTFVRSEAKNASDPIYGENGLLTFGARPKHPGSQPRTLGGAPSGVLLQQGKSFATEVQGRKCKLCNDAHPLYACGKFRALKPSDRLKFLNSNQMCINCFLDNHVVKDCFKDSRCHIDGCTGKHSRFLHALLTQDGYSGSTDGVNQDSNSVSATTFATDSRPKVCLPTVQVNVNESFDALALLDTCSNSTFCSRVLFDKLDMNDTMLKSVDLELSTLNSSVKHERAHVVPSIEVKGQQGSSFILKNVYVVDKIPFQNCSFDVRKYAHLADIPVCSEFKTVDLLIGQDNSSVLIPLEVRKGDKFDQPFAVRTLLGWSIHGVVNNKYSGYCGMIYNQPRQSVICNFISNVSGTGQSVQKGSVEMKLDRLWKIDCELNSEEYVGVSKVDQEVLDLWNESVVVDDSQHYQLPIPWKPEVHVPNNYEVALSRLKSLNKSLEKRDLMQRYDSEIQKLLDNKFAEVVPLSDFESFETEDSKRVWYLPHHAVINDKKPDKLRVVFDCAAEFRGSSLNDKCKQGPDLINKLVHVLLRFRQFQFAIMSDIEAMYYQVRVDPKDRDALRFLWFDKQGNIVQYRMTVHVFGGIWCACISTYALRRILDDQNVTDMFIQNVVNRSFYVDDCLLSASDICSLQRLVVDVRQVLKQGGFNLTKFVTNSAEVMSQIAVQDRAKEAKEFNDDIQSKALGIKWEVIPDSFVITVGKLDRSRSGSFISKRDMLSTLASMYDPLGLVIPYTMKGKMIFQEATRVKLDWGDKLPEWLSQQWKVWLEEAEELKDLQFFRCLIPNEFIDSVVEVHNFSDASEKGYGCCSYMRCIKGNKVHVSLIASKGRLCPIKQMSIPRLELQAAVMAANLNHTIVKQLDVQISKSYFWTDSQIVLSYIQNEDKRFKTFVANRVEQIKSLTSKDQWAYVASKQNPADLISRGTNPSTLSQSIWTKGPEFLSVPDLPNPSVQIVFEIDDKDTEVKVKSMVTEVSVESTTQHFIDKIIQRYNSWYKIKRIVARLIQVKHRLLCKTKVCDITTEILKEAEVIIIRHIQKTSFAEELYSLKTVGVVKKTSDIRNLSPRVNEEGLIVVGGRVEMTEESINKHPYIISHKHPISYILAREFHERAHVGTEWTLSLLRQQFWVTRARIAIKKILKDCLVCKKLFGKPLVQQMSSLPKERLEAFKAPFTNVGIDCFGPFFVKCGRATVKRYGCIFTCFSIRAVHLEKLNSLETDSFISSLRRFIARRGNLSQLWSDNGTNFVGAEAELARDVQDFLLRRNVSWHFNPPHASHMGGVWERQIRTVRKVLQGLLDKYSGELTDEILETLFCEVESMVNSRPITKLTDDTNDKTAITPNQLISVANGPVYYPSDYKKSDMLRKRWRFVQYLANQFWRKWVKMYLPELQKRRKWLKEQRNLEEGDLVLLVEEVTPRYLWPMGIVEEVKLGRDGLVRVVKVKTNTTTLIRPISKVVALEFLNASNIQQKGEC